jgi:acetyltransferase
MIRSLEHSLSVSIRPVTLAEFETLIPALADLLRDSVNRGASLGFMAPLAHHEARNYWLSLRGEMQTGTRLLLAATIDGRLIGSGQLSLPVWSSATHRAEIQKLFVASAARGLGIGKSLMAALHDLARQRGRSLVLLGTRSGDSPEKFYKALGYREAGVIPGYTIDSSGQRHDSLMLYRQLSG